ncbi:hypothetical protein FCS83_00395 [Oenococcus sp. UCMA 17063]|nr:hypothetical protein [Oenococcus sp. UCMA 17063]
MNLRQHQQWLIDFYKQRGWYSYSSFIRLNYLTEEVGELSRAVRALEIGRDHPGEKKQSHEFLENNLKEELADILDQLLIFCDKYDIKIDDLLQASEGKLKKRFE